MIIGPRSHLLEHAEVKDLIEFLAKNEYINELIFPPLKSKSPHHRTVGYTDRYEKDKVRDMIFLKFIFNYCKFEVFPFFKEKYFYDLFVRLMYYLQSIYKKWYHLSSLTSFEMETTRIELDDGVIIRRTKSEEFLVMNEKCLRGHSFNEKYLIELSSDMTSDTTQSFFGEDVI